MARGKRRTERTHCVSVRLDDAEHQVWPAAARLAGHRQLATYIRRVVNERIGRARGGDTPARQPLQGLDRATYQQLVRVGNNLNQAARKAHIEGFAEAASELIIAGKECRIAINDLLGHRPPADPLAEDLAP